MADLNRVELIGRVGKEPEIRTMANGGKLCNFSLATTETWKDKSSGEKKEQTQWHNISIFNEGIVGIIERYVKKGSRLFIEGALKTRKWTDQSGQDRYTTEIVLSGFNGKIILLDGRTGSSDSRSESSEPSRTATRTAREPAHHGSERNDLDDEIPF